ncbi:flavodoxin family protein [Fusibacter ferrireducens]|uniref:Flavodoxin family protein n=1 Tax=Fusibacter ferrireducens TaxID=2785058 RepID=A0ABR9ZQN7_9FIRM|nr:flavodoxin family protein [Fusibacter ferrireducens]MBF4692631.1 flavodoxin family protein [Fusibacter ferrireducens]
MDKAKSAIVYYSWTGNTKIVAEVFGQLLDVPIEPIVEKKMRASGNIPLAALSALLGFKSRIEPLTIDLNAMTTLFVAGQVWAGHSTPAINSFIHQTDFKDKKVWLILTGADENRPEKVIHKLQSKIIDRGGEVLGIYTLKTRALIGNKDIVTHEEVRASIEDWLKQNNLL